MDPKKLDEFRVALRHLCDMAALCAAGVGDEEECAKHLRTCSEFLEGVEEQWRSIESAPKDGTTILAYDPARRGYAARQDIIPVCWSSWGGGCWQNATSGHNIATCEPTRWMPLPELPKEEKES